MQRVLIAIAIFTLPFVVNAQQFSGGVLAGITATQVDGDGYGGYNRLGANVGTWVGYTFTPTIALRTELKFIQKGSFRKNQDEFGGVLGYYSLRLNYIEMPYVVEYHFREDFIPFVGLSFGYLWKAKESDASGSLPDEDIAMFRKFEMAGTAGVEYRINHRFSFIASMSYSIIPVRPHKGYITYRLNQGQYNNVLQFYLRYHF
jgi:hypothetical protein